TTGAEGPRLSHRPDTQPPVKPKRPETSLDDTLRTLGLTRQSMQGMFSIDHLPPMQKSALAQPASSHSHTTEWLSPADTDKQQQQQQQQHQQAQTTLEEKEEDSSDEVTSLENLPEFWNQRKAGRRALLQQEQKLIPIRRLSSKLVNFFGEDLDTLQNSR